MSSIGEDRGGTRRDNSLFALEEFLAEYARQQGQHPIVGEEHVVGAAQFPLRLVRLEFGAEFRDSDHLKGGGATAIDA
jgi:hypothetical protein